MWKVILELTKQIFSSLVPVGKFLLKHWKVMLPIIVIAVMVIYGLLRFRAYENEIRDWKNQAGKYRGLYEVTDNKYETQAIEVKKLKIDNEYLRERLEDTDRKAKMYAEMCFEYKARLDAIDTEPRGRDTVWLKDSTKVDPRDRVFNEIFNNELTLKGYFQPYHPYKLFITELKLLFGIDILLAQDEDDVWFYTIDTKSDYLVPRNVNVQVKPNEPRKWFMYYGIDGIFMHSWDWKGLSGRVGIGYGTWGLNIGCTAVEGLRPSLNIGIQKILEF